MSIEGKNDKKKSTIEKYFINEDEAIAYCQLSLIRLPRRRRLRCRWREYLQLIHL